MSSNNNNDNNNDNQDNQDNDDNSPVQPRRNILLDAFNSLRTPLRDRSRNERQQSIERQQHQQQDILTLEADLGLATTLFGEEDIEDTQERKEEKEEEKEKEKEKETIMTTSTTTTYKIGGVEIEFNAAEPAQNTDYNVGVMMSKEDRPDSGTDTERKLIESLCKNQYTKYKKAETSMKSVERLLQSRSIMDTIEATETILNRFDMKDPHHSTLTTQPSPSPSPSPLNPHPHPHLAQVKFSDGKRDAAVAGKYISSTEITCNTPSFEKFGPMDVVVRVAIKSDPFTVNKAIFRFYVNTKVH